MASKSTIIYTKTDEAPALATQSFLPLIQAFTKSSNIEFKVKDISLAARILALFPERLTKTQQVEDALSTLGEMVKQPEANIIKLPNISASVPQLKKAIAELQQAGYDIPTYPEDIENEEDEALKKLYGKVKGSAVNPVLREGNSDRRAPKAVKKYARNNPHSMGKWSSESKSHVVSMSQGDFYGSEKSTTFEKENSIRIIFSPENGDPQILKDFFPIEKGEIVDGAVLSKKELIAFLEKEIKDAKDKNVLFSVHLKATMMKVSDPIIFGHVVRTFLKPVFDKHHAIFDQIGVNVNNGYGNLLSNLDEVLPEKRAEIEADLKAQFENSPSLAMVNSDKGITNLHVPSDVIIDASMPAMIRNSGQMWNAEGNSQDTKAVIPDRAYAGIYQATIDFCKKHGAFDPTTMGSVSNVGLMAQKAEEYGSHDKTFEIESAGKVQVIDQEGNQIFSFSVQEGDIFRMCQVKDAPIKNWVKLAVGRARSTKTPTIFWLDNKRAHDKQLIEKVEKYLGKYETSELDIQILSPIKATNFSLKRIIKGEDTISVTGNVLRDYLTDLFPILEVGTSAKMLSIVPLMNGGGLFETGAGGSAPKHVQQFVEENHLRWDSLGEFLALVMSLKHLGKVEKNEKAKVLAKALSNATATLLENRKSPSRKVNELDNRGSHFYLSMYWAQELAKQNDNQELKNEFSPIAKKLAKNEEAIVNEMNQVQGKSIDTEGYYYPNMQILAKEMRPSAIFNEILNGI